MCYSLQRDRRGELLGFDRTAALTGQPSAIADAAQRWAQEDDITVLTLTVAPESVAGEIAGA